MKAIHRFEIPMEEAAETGGYFTLELPLTSIPLYVDVQDRAPHAPCVWALVDQGRELAKRRFLMAGTGHTFPDFDYISKSEYIGTFQQNGFVWHIWEVPA
jgi:hypothetical protein